MTEIAKADDAASAEPAARAHLRRVADQLLELAATCDQLADGLKDGAARQDAPHLRLGHGHRAAASSPFTITPLGGAEEVGGSALLVETLEGTVLLDAGQRVAGEYGDPDADGQFHFVVSGIDRLDAVLVSHAHIDHVGSLPVLLREHERLQGDMPQVWMSAPTLDLAQLMLDDSASIQASRAGQLRTLAETAESDMVDGAVTRMAYEAHDVRRAMDNVQIAEPDRGFRIPGTELMAKFQPVSHVLGACAIHLRHLPTGATLLYTGDLGPATDPQETLPPRVPGQTLDPADVVIMESTYGGGETADQDGRRSRLSGREKAIQQLTTVAERAFAQGGFVLLPAFSLGRTQELLRILAGGRLPEAPIYSAGMGERITMLYSDWAARRDGVWATQGPLASGVTSVNKWTATYVDFADTAAEILSDQRPGYLICGPAMLSGGWSRAFLEHMAGDERHAVALTGYVARHAGGIPGLHRLHRGERIQLSNGWQTLRCDWTVLRGLSAHAPARDLQRFALDIARGRSVAFACVHGERAAQENLASWISESVPGAVGYSMRRGVPWRPSVST
jgi:Cft2 family RNA processing exonuclease